MCRGPAALSKTLRAPCVLVAWPEQFRRGGDDRRDLRSRDDLRVGRGLRQPPVQPARLHHRPAGPHRGPRPRALGLRRAHPGARPGRSRRGRDRHCTGHGGAACRRGPRGQGHLRRGRPSDPGRHPPARRQRRETGLHRGAPAPRGRNGASRQDPYGAVRLDHRRHQPRPGHAPQSLAPGPPCAGRIEQRLRRRGGSGPRAHGAGQRHRRLGARAGVAVRHRGAQDDGRTGQPGRRLPPLRHLRFDRPARSRTPHSFTRS